jgi:hypothetical protein
MKHADLLPQLGSERRVAGEQRIDGDVAPEAILEVRRTSTPSRTKPARSATWIEPVFSTSIPKLDPEQARLVESPAAEESERARRHPSPARGSRDDEADLTLAPFLREPSHAYEAEEGRAARLAYGEPGERALFPASQVALDLRAGEAVCEPNGHVGEAATSGSRAIASMSASSSSVSGSRRTTPSSSGGEGGSRRSTLERELAAEALRARPG